MFLKTYKRIFLTSSPFFSLLIKFHRPHAALFHYLTQSFASYQRRSQAGRKRACIKFASFVLYQNELQKFCLGVTSMLCLAQRALTFVGHSENRHLRRAPEVMNGWMSVWNFFPSSNGNSDLFSSFRLFSFYQNIVFSDPALDNGNFWRFHWTRCNAKSPFQGMEISRCCCFHYISSVNYL